MEVNHELMLSLKNGRILESACSSDVVSFYSLNECFWAGRSPFCEIVLAQSPVYGKVLFLDKELQSAESDEAIYHEHLVHPALNALAGIKEKSVLIVGGGEGATAREVLKWSQISVKTVDWVDIDGHLVDLCRRHLSWADDSVYNDFRLHYYKMDICDFWASNNNKYDLIILDLPDPDVQKLLTNDSDLLYGRQFMRVMTEHLVDGGAFVSHCGPIAPGGDPIVRRAGMTWINDVCAGQNLSVYNYHTVIPSFMSSWGFVMSCKPSLANNYPEGLAVMDIEAQHTAFNWPRFWTSPFIGHP